jgi:Glycosyl hydrolase family 76
MEHDHDQLHASRDKIFDRLCEIWAETRDATDPDTKKAWNDDIWRKANTLQAVAQYWKTVRNSAPTRAEKAMTLMKEGYEFYRKKKEDKGIWVDDFGWWGGFFTDLHDYTAEVPLRSPSSFTLANLLAETEYCYKSMQGNLDDVHGGIWNDPDIESVYREKNTITNNWLLNLAANLFAIGNAEHRNEYKSVAEGQYRWLTTGKYGSYAPKEKKWRLYTAEGTLLWVVEGPFTLGENHAAFKDAFWTGDEGVFLRGLSSFINGIAAPALKQELVRDSQKLIIAAMKAFVDTQHVMHESPRNQAWNNDLATGKGVFMRLVARFVYQQKFFADKKFEEAFREFVGKTADAVCRREIPETTDKKKWVIAPNWNPPFGPPEEGDLPTSGELWPQVLQTDGLDALNAAVHIGL